VQIVVWLEVKDRNGEMVFQGSQNGLSESEAVPTAKQIIECATYLAMSAAIRIWGEDSGIDASSIPPMW
jgi:hypothetical protein